MNGGVSVENFKKTLYYSLVYEDRYKFFLDGLKNTIILTIVSFILGTFFGILLCWLKKDARETAKSLDKARELSPKRNIKNSLARNLILVLKLIQKLVKFIEMIEQKILKTIKGLLRKCGSPFFALLNIENMIYR